MQSLQNKASLVIAYTSGALVHFLYFDPLDETAVNMIVSSATCCSVFARLLVLELSYSSVKLLDLSKKLLDALVL